jgi:hypothetical protein
LFTTDTWPSRTPTTRLFSTSSIPACSRRRAGQALYEQRQHAPDKPSVPSASVGCSSSKLQTTTLSTCCDSANTEAVPTCARKALCCVLADLAVIGGQHVVHELDDADLDVLHQVRVVLLRTATHSSRQENMVSTGCLWLQGMQLCRPR